MLVEHGIDHVNKSLVAGKKTMTPAEKISFQPSLQGVLTQHFHHPAIRREIATVPIFRKGLGHPTFGARLINSIEFIRGRLIRPEDSEIIRILAQDFREEPAERFGVFHLEIARFFHLDSVFAKIGEMQGLPNRTAISHGVSTHATVSAGCQALKFGTQLTVPIEMFFRMVAPHPFFKQVQVCGIVRNAGDRDLMRAPGAFDLMAIDLSRTSPAFR
jgi:hypothetical protein